MQRRTLIALCASLAAVATMPQAGAQGAYPNRPITLIVPYGAGGVTDVIARALAQGMSKPLGQTIVIENKPGASGNIGTMAALGAPADGYTLLFSAASFTIVPAAVRPDQPYDLLRDLVPIVQIGVGGLFLAVAPDLPVKSVPELFELARKEPGKYSYGTTGIGSTGHLIMASLLSQRGLQMTHVPYKSSADVLRDLSGGVLQVGWVDTTSSLGAIQAGKVRALAHGSTYRAPRSPDIPPLNDVGIAWNLNGWLGLFARTGTPMAIVRAINAEVSKLVQSEEGKARLVAMNTANPPPTSPEEFAQMIRRDLPAWRKIVVDNQIKPES